MHEAAGKFCVIPYDGRISLTPTPDLIQIWALSGDLEATRERIKVKSLAEVTQLNEFDSLLRRCGNAGLFVSDLDPWYDWFVIYEGLNKFDTIHGNPRYPDGEVYFRRLSWDYQSSDMNPKSFEKGFESIIEKGERVGYTFLILTMSIFGRSLLDIRLTMKVCSSYCRLEQRCPLAPNPVSGHPIKSLDNIITSTGL
jgi:hypothetical protein